MKVSYEEESFIRNSIKACETKKHLQQVAFSTFHNCLTQICFTCNVCLTSLPYQEQVKMKSNQSLKSFNVRDKVLENSINNDIEKLNDVFSEVSE